MENNRNPIALYADCLFMVKRLINSLALGVVCDYVAIINDKKVNLQSVLQS